jgi:hypothetical protein
MEGRVGFAPSIDLTAASAVEARGDGVDRVIRN